MKVIKRSPYISLIIPHYNAQASLSALLRSLPYSRYDDLEIIVVDDSNNLDVNLIRSLIDGISISVLGVKNRLGAGGARNLGLEAAAGEWVIFADADDSFTSSLCGLLECLTSLRDPSIDLVYFDIEDDLPAPHKNSRVCFLKTVLHSGSHDDLRYGHTVPWGKFIRRSLIVRHSIKFDEVPASNDVMFSINCGHFARNIAVFNIVGYTWKQQANSITTTVSEANLLSKIDVALRANQFLVSVGAKRYRHSVLYPIYRLLRFGFWKTFLVVIKYALAGGNPLIGITNIFAYKQIVKRREGFFE